MARGKLRIYLGAAPGVGKTFAMLNEGWRAHSARHRRRRRLLRDARPAEHRRADPRPRGRSRARRSSTAGTTFEEMDVDAVLARKPEVALVDELAHTNVPGSRNEKRWQDVEELLDAGIDVISTLNIQHLESVNDVVERDHRRQAAGDDPRRGRPAGRAGRARRHDARGAAPPHGARQHLPGRAGRRRRSPTTSGSATSPRCASSRCCGSPTGSTRPSSSTSRTTASTAPWETRERVVVALTGAPGGDVLIRRAARMARRTPGRAPRRARPPDRRARRSARPELLEQHRQLLAELGGTYQEVAASDVGDALVTFAKAENATQLVLGASRRSRWTRARSAARSSTGCSAPSGPIDVHVISTERARGRRHVDVAASPAAPRPAISAASAVGWRCSPSLRPAPRHARCSTWPRASSSLPERAARLPARRRRGRGDRRLRCPRSSPRSAAFLLAQLLLHAAVYTFTIAEDENLVALVVFLVVGCGRRRASSSRAARRRARRRAQAQRRGRDARRLQRHAAQRAGSRCPRSWRSCAPRSAARRSRCCGATGDGVDASRAGAGEPVPDRARGRAG